MKIAVFSFVKVSTTSTIASVRIARFITRVLADDRYDVELLDDERIATTRWDLLILVNGAFSFCSVRDDVAVAVRRAKRIVWVQNDYMIYPPIADGVAKSTFREAFVIRHDRGLPDMDYWTTVERYADRTKGSAYVNWNALTARPEPLRCNPHALKDLFYYGAFRSGRARTFDAYLKSTRIPIVISSTSRKFIERYPHAEHHAAIPRVEFYWTLNTHGFGLYIEDSRSHREFHSPANRFYEMLSAGLPMVFEPDSYTMLKKAGFSPKDFIVRRAKDVVRLLPERMAIQAEQRERWWSPFRGELRSRLQSVFARYLRRHY